MTSVVGVTPGGRVMVKPLLPREVTPSTLDLEATSKAALSSQPVRLQALAQPGL